MDTGIGRNILAGLAVSLMALLAASTASAGTIVGSNHDLSTKGYGTTQICIFCHTPHNALNTAGVPLWNHASSTATYTVYSSPTMNATVGQPGASSKLCLSCHDGTVAVDSYGGRTGTVTITGGANFGTALSNDHPIGITYNAALATADGALANPDTKIVTIGTSTGGPKALQEVIQARPGHGRSPEIGAAYGQGFTVMGGQEKIAHLFGPVTLSQQIPYRYHARVF